MLNEKSIFWSVSPAIKMRHIIFAYNSFPCPTQSQDGGRKMEFYSMSRSETNKKYSVNYVKNYEIIRKVYLTERQI